MCPIIADGLHSVASTAFLDHIDKGFGRHASLQLPDENGAGTRASELCRNYGISEATQYNWKAQYAGITSELSAVPLEEAVRPGETRQWAVAEADLNDRIEKLERLVVRLTLGNEFPRKELRYSVSQAERNGKRLAAGGASSAVSG